MATTRNNDRAALLAKILVLERRLVAAQREIDALRATRDVAVRVAVWGGRRVEPGR